MRFQRSEERGADAPQNHSDQQLVTELEELRSRFERLEERFDSRRIEVSPNEVQSVITARALRFDLFPAGLFADPAWDMLLHLYAQALQQQRVAVSKLCTASAVPDTTALRHMRHLEREGLIARRPDSLDGRRLWVELSAVGSLAMRKYFQARRTTI